MHYGPEAAERYERAQFHIFLFIAVSEIAVIGLYALVLR